MSAAKTTIDHDEIRQWVEARGGKPACVMGTGGKHDPGMLRIEFSDASSDKLHPLSWDDWFEAFDANGLAFLYQEEKGDGETSTFNKLVSRDTVKAREKGDHHASVHHPHGR